jgi:uncharacterized protein with von Willebrand factor type A (vWA) domain
MTSVGRAPLLDVFLELRRRGFPLGFPEYRLVLEALARHQWDCSHARLIFIVKLLWAKDLEDQAQVEEVFNSFLPAATKEDVERLMAAVEAEARAEELGKPKVQRPRPGSLRAALRNLFPKVDKPDGEPDPLQLAAGEAVIQPGFGFALPATRPWSLQTKVDFVGALPVTRRQMKRAWRYFRRMQRIGPPTELDVDATIDAISRHGTLLQPVMIPRRQNLARLVILKDEGGSMTPFSRVTDPLLESINSSGLSHAVWYFRNLPTESLFCNPSLSEAIPFDAALERWRGAGMLIISDAGAARRTSSHGRNRATIRFVERLRRWTPHLAWLNPTPASRWAGTPADTIRIVSGIPMMPIDRRGLDEAVQVIRGRSERVTRA